MRLKTTEVVVGKRIRRDIDAGIRVLAASIEELGQLQPIVIDEGKKLIAGARRLRACELLGREVEAVVASNLADALPRLKAERDENTCRIDFTPEEAVECGRAIETLEKPKAKERQREHGGTAPGKKNTCGNLPQVNGDSGRTRDKVAAAVGMSPRTYDNSISMA